MFVWLIHNLIPKNKQIDAQCTVTPHTKRLRPINEVLLRLYNPWLILDAFYVLSNNVGSCHNIFMGFRIFLLIGMAAIQLNAVNFFPLPDSIKNEFRVTPMVSKFSFRSLSLFADQTAGGKILDGFGVGLKWGPQYSGGEFIIHLLDFTDTKGTQSGSSLAIETSQIKATQMKYRHYLPVIVDEFTGMALFASVGQFFGDFIRRNYVDGGAVTEYSMRHVSGNLIDFGVSICYKLNPDWALNMHVLYQYSVQKKTTNPAHSTVNDVNFDYTGAEFALGTSIKL